MKHTVFTATDKETERLGSGMVGSLEPGTILALSGSLGAGKTVFIRGLARGLGIAEHVTSPSFTLVSEYEGTKPLIHVDLYRTGSDEELELMGIDEILSRPAIVAIEWAEKAGSFLSDATDRIIRVWFEIMESGRKITIEGAEIELDDDALN